MKNQLQAVVTVLSLVNPAICGMMFARAEAGRPRAGQLADAIKAAAAMLVILAMAALAGTRLLDLFGVSLDAFMVAGGGVLAWMGFSMLRGGPTSQAPPAHPGNGGTSLMPLVLFAASPGTITGVITISAAHTRLELPVTALAAVGVAVAITWLVMVLTSRLERVGDSRGFARDIATRFMGLIVLSMGVQFALTGLHAFGAGGAAAPV